MGKPTRTTGDDYKKEGMERVRGMQCATWPVQMQCIVPSRRQYEYKTAIEPGSVA